MAFSVTNRGYASKVGASTDSVSDTFTPAANSLLLVVSNGLDGILDSISDTMSDTGAWAEVLSYQWTAQGTRRIKVWGCIVGASPSSGAITVVNGYQERLQLEFYEVTDVDLSGGTPASCIGVNGGIDGYRTTNDQTLTLSAFAADTNYTFAIAASPYTSAAITYSEGNFTEGTDRSAFSRFRCAWLGLKDLTIVITHTAWVYNALFGFEIKAASAAPSGNPWYYYAQQ